MFNVCQARIIMLKFYNDRDSILPYLLESTYHGINADFGIDPNSIPHSVLTLMPMLMMNVSRNTAIT